METVRLISWGMVKLHELPQAERRAIQKVARDDAHSRGFWISGCKHERCCTIDIYHMPDGRILPTTQGEHKLTRWNKKLFANPRRPGINDRNKPLGTGSFVDCCALLASLITPSDDNKFGDATHG